MSLYENGPTSFGDASFSYYTGGNPSFSGVSNTELNNRKIYEASQFSKGNLSTVRQVTGIVTIPSGALSSQSYYPVILDTPNTDSLDQPPQATVPLHSIIKNIEISYIPYNTSGDIQSIQCVISPTNATFSKVYNGTNNPIQLLPSYTQALLNQPATQTAIANSTAVSGNIKLSTNLTVGTTNVQGIYIWLSVLGARQGTFSSTVRIRITVNYSDSQDLNN